MVASPPMGPRTLSRTSARVARTCALCAALLAWSTAARAQRALEVDRFHPALDETGFVGVQGTRTPGSERVHLGWFTTYASALLEAEQNGETFTLVDDRVTTHLSAEFGLGGRAAVALVLPAILHQRGVRLSADEPKLLPIALGDPRVGARYRVLGDDADREDRHRDGPGLALAAEAALPAGDDDTYAGERATRIETRLLGDFQLLGAGLGASVGWRHRFRRAYPVDPALSDTSLHDEFLFGAGLKLPIPPLYPLVAVAELRGATDFASRHTTAIEGDLGARIGLGEVVLLATAGTGLTGGIGAPGFRAIIGVWFAPAPDDADADGVLDADDGCPYLPEDRDGFQDHDGCPDPDDDNDLIPDTDDLCPREEALEGRDEDEDGCTDPA